MYPVWAVVATLGLIIGWLGVLTYLVFSQSSFLKDLFPKDNSRDIRNKFKEVVDAISVFEKNNEILDNRLTGFKKESLANISKLSVLKYNPYNDTGGEQSFSLVFLDGKLNGALITSLHTRSGTRIYLKNIKNGKSDLELSKEESKVLNQAIEE